ncbi:kinase-like domain-containing protein [Melanogaster broomeanus]|nr:kinase-like domain-containing protein [Melanogaster broomeanus]
MVSHKLSSWRSVARTSFFRFGIPLVLKKTCRTTSTEADALRYMNQVAPHLPIPKLIHSFELDGAMYTLMTRLPGRRFLDMRLDISARDVEDNTIQEIMVLLRQLWTLSQPSEIRGKVMISASGHGLPHPRIFHEGIGGPYDSTLECYDSMVLGNVSDLPPRITEALANDPVVWVHTDLRMQNILIDDKGHVTGVVDWEDSGWLPKHWQLHMLRRPQLGCMGPWVELWRNRYRFDEVTETAYQASMSDGVLVYPL